MILNDKQKKLVIEILEKYIKIFKMQDMSSNKITYYSELVTKVSMQSGLYYDEEEKLKYLLNKEKESILNSKILFKRHHAYKINSIIYKLN